MIMAFTIGHLYYGGPKELAKKRMVHGLPWTTSRNFVKDVYLVNKDKFLKKGRILCKKIFSWFTPTCDPITSKSFSEKSYFIIFH